MPRCFTIAILPVLLLSVAFGQDSAPATQPATAPANATTPQGTLTLLSRATNSGDTREARGLLHAQNADEQKLADVLMERTEVYAMFRKAAVNAFGEGAADELTGNTRAAAIDSERRIAAANVAIQDDTAIVEMEGQEPVKMVRVDGKWKLSVTALTDGMGAGDVDTKLRQIQMLSTVVRETSDEIGQGKYKGPDEVNDAIRAKLAMIMLRPEPGSEPATQPAQH